MTEIEGLTSDFSALESLSMINVGLQSLTTFPKLGNLKKVRPSGLPPSPILATAERFDAQTFIHGLIQSLLLLVLALVWTDLCS